MKKGALIGFGYWGRTLARAFKQTKAGLSLSVFDPSPKARKTALSSGFSVCHSLKEIEESKEISFLIIAAPPAAHYSLVERGLRSNKHILVEKPFGWSFEDKKPLFAIARQNKKVLMIDYTYLYSPGFKKLKECLKNTKIISYESLRLNSQLARADINVLNDLMIHDLSMLVDMIPSKPLNGSCRPVKLKGKTEQQAFAFIYGVDWQAVIFASRVWTDKIRTVVVRTPKKTLCFEEKNKQTYLSSLKAKSSQKLKTQNKSSLEFMFEEFFERIKSKTYIKDFKRYHNITALLKALNKSIKQNGKNTKIDWRL